MSGPRWLTELRGTADAATDLYCFPAAGAGSLGYWSWLAHLSGELNLAVAVLPGRDQRLREPPARRMEQVAGELAAAITQRGRRPYVLFGHSMGAVVAHAVAQETRERGLQGPQALVVFGAPAPDAAWPDQDAHLRGDEEFAEVIRRIGGTPDEVFADPRQRALVLNALRADFELAAEYKPDDRPLDFPVVALYGSDDPRLSELGARTWRRHTTAGFRCAAMPGGHFAPTADPAGFVKALEMELTAVRRNER